MDAAGPNYRLSPDEVIIPVLVAIMVFMIICCIIPCDICEWCCCRMMRNGFWFSTTRLVTCDHDRGLVVKEVLPHNSAHLFPTYKKPKRTRRRLLSCRRSKKSSHMAHNTEPGNQGQNINYHQEEEGKMDNDDLVCRICLENFQIGEKIAFSENLSCLHVFHHKCISTWLNLHNNCPCCRGRFVKSDRPCCHGRKSRSRYDEKSCNFCVQHGLVYVCESNHDAVEPVLQPELSAEETNNSDTADNNSV